MVQRADSLSTPELDHEAWTEALRPKWWRYDPKTMESNVFTGRARPRSLYGFTAI
jgi:hypothetical protein